jgi:hypothetical protein
LEVSVTFYFGRKREADLDNFNKPSADALTGIALTLMAEPDAK